MRIRPAGGRPLPDTAGEILLCPQRGVPGVERIAIYADGLLARTCEALAEAYPAIRHLVGEGVFRSLAHEYARHHPSHEYNLSAVGRHLAEFLSAVALAKRFPFLPDLARLEWCVQRAFHAKEQPPWDLRGRSSMPIEEWERTRFRFQPSVAVVSSSWPILDLWQARTQPVESIHLDLLNRPQQVVIFRRGLTVACERLDSQPARLLQGLLDGQSLGETCAQWIREAPGDELPPVASWFARWGQAGLMTGCESLGGDS